MSQLNVNCSRDFRNQVLTVEPRTRCQPWSVAASRPWRRHLKSTSASRTSICIKTRFVPRAPRPGVWWAPLNAAACHDVVFSTSSYSEKFGWFAGAVVSSFISDRVELSNTPNPAVCHIHSYTVCRCWMKPWISGLFFQVLNQRDSTCLSWMSFFLSISDIRFCLKGPRTRRQPWSVAASRP